MSDTDEGVRPYCAADDHAFPDDRLNMVLETILDDPEIEAYLEAQNVNPVTRKGYNDHGTKHIEIVRDRALCLYELLKRGGVGFNGAADQGLDEADESVIIALAATLHDIGHVVHRDDHPYYSIPLAADILDRLLSQFYATPEAVRVKAEVLHAILCHHVEEDPLTTEAGVIRIADALDMERGRSRIPYDRGSRGVNTLSSQAIHRVTLQAGEETPILVRIEMTDAVGVYQVDELLNAKVTGSGLHEEIRIMAVKTDDGSGELVERLEV
jgi:metal-dependent HD superfamily phosphatase/phosphodiesterase